MFSFIIGYIIGKSNGSPDNSGESLHLDGLFDLCFEHPKMTKFIAASFVIWACVINPIDYFGWRTDHITRNEIQIRELDIMIKRASQTKGAAGGRNL